LLLALCLAGVGEPVVWCQSPEPRKDPYFTVNIGHRMASVCHLVSIASGRKPKWDPEKETFVGDEQANAICEIRPMRGEWSLTG